jgi:hypothetical protein
MRPCRLCCATDGSAVLQVEGGREGGPWQKQAERIVDAKEAPLTAFNFHASHTCTGSFSTAPIVAPNPGRVPASSVESVAPGCTPAQGWASRRRNRPEQESPEQETGVSPHLGLCSCSDLTAVGVIVYVAEFADCPTSRSLPSAGPCAATLRFIKLLSAWMTSHSGALGHMSRRPTRPFLSISPVGPRSSSNVASAHDWSSHTCCPQVMNAGKSAWPKSNRWDSMLPSTSRTVGEGFSSLGTARTMLGCPDLAHGLTRGGLPRLPRLGSNGGKAIPDCCKFCTR